MCPCNRLVGVICAAHCKGNGCRDGQHTDLCRGPGRLPLTEAYYRRGVLTDPDAILRVAEVERAAHELLRSL